MIDPTDMEITAMRSCLTPLGQFVGDIGMDRALADYSKDEILQLIDVVVTAYQAHMLAEHQRMAAMDRAFLEQRIAIQQGLAATGAVS